MMQKPKTISIIGGTGQMGEKFAAEFKKQGMEVLVSGRSTMLTNKEIAARGDIVIVTVPIRDTLQVIEEIIPVLKSDAMITDFTSVKMMPVEAMAKANVGVTVMGGHPLFGPTTDLSHQHFILCCERGSTYVKWYKQFLESLGLNVLEMTKEDHDRQMATIQCLTHFSTLSLGSALEKLQYDLQQGEKIATPVYLMRIYGVGRILAQDPDLYTDIQLYNPFAKETIARYKEAVDELFTTVEQSDARAFHDIFACSKKYFGAVAARSMEMTDKLIHVISK